MKKTLLIIFICFLSNFVWSQIVFNKIIEDTIGHITSSVVVLDTGYVFLSGTGNELGIRSIALTYVGLDGNKVWKRIYGHEENEYWEGYSNCFKYQEGVFSSTGTLYNQNTSSWQIYLNNYNNSLTTVSSNVLDLDLVWKKAFNQVYNNNDYFITGQKRIPELETSHMLLIKLNSEHDVIWEKTYGDRYEAGTKIISTTDNKLVIGGTTNSFPPTNSEQDWYLSKIDTAGNVIWAKGFGSGIKDDGLVVGIIETQDSNYIASGSYPVYTIGSTNYKDGCLRKVSKDGELVWTKYYRTYSKSTSDKQSIRESIYSIYEDSIGNMYTIGSSYDSKPFYRGCFTKLNSNGEIIFRRLYYAIDEFSNEQYLKVIQPTNDRGFIFAGYGNSYDWYDYDPAQQAWLVKTDSLGLDGLCYTEVPELNIDIEIPEIVCKNDTIEVYAYIVGKSAPYTIELSTGQVIDSIYYPPLFVPIEIGLSQTSVMAGGEEFFSEQISEATLSNHEWGQCIAKPIEFYTPQFIGTHVIDITVTDAYGESKTITKMFYAQNCDDNIETKNVCPVKLYPNPTTDKVYVDIPDDITPETAEIYNSVGQLIRSISLHSGLNIINVSEFASGSYILKVNSKEDSFSLGFEKE